MKTKTTVVVAAVLLLAGITSLFALTQSRVIKSVTDQKDVVLTRSIYNVIQSDEPQEQRLVYSSYISGFFDAVQLEEAGVPEVKQFLNDCNGMELRQITEEMFKFYRDNPDMRNKKPSDFLIYIVPRIKKGLPLVPEEKAN